jgi:hypothetical protein
MTPEQQKILPRIRILVDMASRKLDPTLSENARKATLNEQRNAENKALQLAEGVGIDFTVMFPSYIRIDARAEAELKAKQEADRRAEQARNSGINVAEFLRRAQEHARAEWERKQREQQTQQTRTEEPKRPERDRWEVKSYKVGAFRGDPHGEYYSVVYRNGQRVWSSKYYNSRAGAIYAGNSYVRRAQ